MEHTNGWSAAQAPVMLILAQLQEGQNKLQEDVNTLQQNVSVLMVQRVDNKDKSARRPAWAAVLLSVMAFLASAMPSIHW